MTPRRTVNIFIGQKFNRLTVINPEMHVINNGKRRKMIRCQCSCGNVIDIPYSRLTSGNTTSCGCFRKEHLADFNRKHGEHGTPLYNIWSHMIDRCTNSSAERWKNYGGRGITVCEEWRDYRGFAEWAKSFGYKDGLSIDRIDVNGNYEPSNCRFVPLADQMSNTTRNVKITCFGETKTAAQWGRDPRCPVTGRRILTRISNGWSVIDAILTPSNPANRVKR